MSLECRIIVSESFVSAVLFSCSNFLASILSTVISFHRIETTFCSSMFKFRNFIVLINAICISKFKLLYFCKTFLAINKMFEFFQKHYYIIICCTLHVALYMLYFTCCTLKVSMEINTLKK